MCAQVHHPGRNKSPKQRQQADCRESPPSKMSRRTQLKHKLLPLLRMCAQVHHPGRNKSPKQRQQAGRRESPPSKMSRRTDAAKAQASSSASDVRTSAPPGPQQKPKAEATSGSQRESTVKDVTEDAAKAQASSSASDVRTSAPPGPQQKPKAEATSGSQRESTVKDVTEDTAKAQASASAASDVRTSAPPEPQQEPKAEAASRSKRESTVKEVTEDAANAQAPVSPASDVSASATPEPQQQPKAEAARRSLTESTVKDDAEDPQRRRDRLRSSRSIRSSFSQDAAKSLLRGHTALLAPVPARELDVPAPESAASPARTAQRLVRLGYRFELPSGKGLHLDEAQISDLHVQQAQQEIRQLMERRVLKLGASQLFQQLARVASLRRAQKDLRAAHWAACDAELPVARRAAGLMARRSRGAARSTEELLGRCTEEAARWLQHAGDKEEEVAARCKQLGADLALHRAEMRRLELGDVSGTAPRMAKPRSVTKVQQLARLCTEMDFAETRCEKLRGRIQQHSMPKPCTSDLRLEALRAAAQEARRACPEPSEPSEPSEDEMESRVAAAMELLDVHQPKAVKVRMAGLKQMAIGDQDTFKRLVAQKIAEAINVDAEEVRVRGLRGGVHQP
ncbi:unnamed protein product [Effrenium voratum]|uniref:Uncharacterized protein n=2 Tax=Effrenium voratum TaxID=2562239 RepID=A0AA36J1U6_9DINO|nr:unnamed protein product [Effrenium voratum]